MALTVAAIAVEANAADLQSCQLKVRDANKLAQQVTQGKNRSNQDLFNTSQAKLKSVYSNFNKCEKHLTPFMYNRSVKQAQTALTTTYQFKSYEPIGNWESNRKITSGYYICVDPRTDMKTSYKLMAGRFQSKVIENGKVTATSSGYISGSRTRINKTNDIESVKRLILKGTPQDNDGWWLDWDSKLTKTHEGIIQEFNGVPGKNRCYKTLRY